MSLSKSFTDLSYYMKGIKDLIHGGRQWLQKRKQSRKQLRKK